MTRQTDEHRARIKAHFLSLGWVEGRYGHLERTQVATHPETGKQAVRYWRIRFLPRIVCIEAKSWFGRGWVRAGGAIYSRCIFLPDGRMRVGSMLFRSPPRSEGDSDAKPPPSDRVGNPDASKG